MNWSKVGDYPIYYILTRSNKASIKIEYLPTKNTWQIELLNNFVSEYRKGSIHDVELIKIEAVRIFKSLIMALDEDANSFIGVTF
jgi:hypothetical protein